MPRTPRELADGGIYHVYSRGNNRRNLFQAKEDYDVYLKQMKEASGRFHFDIFHYCLMTNHFHFLLRISKGSDLPVSIRHVKLAYARYYKQKYNFIGHLFQGRFRSPRILEESYYLQCGRYIERNPVRACMVKRAEDYAYSSARHYVEGTCDLLVTRNLYYNTLGKNDPERRENYRSFLLLEDPYFDMINKSLKKC